MPDPACAQAVLACPVDIVGSCEGPTLSTMHNAGPCIGARPAHKNHQIRQTDLHTSAEQRSDRLQLTWTRQVGVHDSCKKLCEELSHAASGSCDVSRTHAEAEISPGSGSGAVAAKSYA